ncbi:MAG TPA: acyl-CoA dehydrogenase family protein [Acidimicrobiia bacterium]|nr:acyl-CoA dehydrogenase family protein [Acidimicrobiia bacterium]
MDDEGRVEELVEKLLTEHDPETEPVEEFLGAQFDAGLAFVHFPEGHGGLGVAPKLQAVVNRRLLAAGAPVGAMRNAIGYGMGAPTIVTHGTEEQKRRYLRPLFTGEEVWCQLFSEPGAGSDVAGLSTRADRDGDEWIVNGQKVWTSLAHFARWGLLVARTNPDVEKHKGLTYFILDMEQDGVEVRPLRQMTGQAEFNEVYFTNARVPDENRLGAVGAGWSTVVTTLMNERVFIGGGIAPRGAGMINAALELWKTSGRTDPELRDRLMQLYTRAETIRLTNARAQQRRAVGNPGPEGSIGKLATAELNQAIGELCVDLMGPEGMLFGNYALDRERTMAAARSADPRVSFLRSRANTIEGGTSEVMRNILGERVLGLPGDVRVDRDVAWKDVPRN